MPHQCLGCGFAFEEGSSALLQGCPECKGTRFFYSATAVDEQERKDIAAKAQNDLGKAVTDLLANAAPEVAKELEERAGTDGWASLKPRDLRRLMKEAQQRDPAELDVPDEELTAAKARLQETMDAIDEREEKPDTVTVHEPGEYEIDIKGLMEKDPLVVHRDGAYMIHLPSLFGK